MPVKCLYVLVLVFSLVAQPCAAQAKVEVGALFGYYQPTGSFRPGDVHSVTLPSEPQELSGVAWGGQARIWFTERVGVQVQVSAAESTSGPVNTPFRGALGAPRPPPGRPTPARVTVGTVGLLFQPFPEWERVRTWLTTGPAFVNHGGEAYAPYGHPTDVGAAVGLGASLRIAGGLRAAAGLTALFYTYALPEPAQRHNTLGSLQNGPQRDGVLYLGLDWSPR